MDSAEKITKATLGFFDEICRHASELTNNLEESQTRNHNYLKKFEKVFEVDLLIVTFSFYNRRYSKRNL